VVNPSSSLLSTKFFIPPPRAGLLARPSLAARFAAGLVCPLTVISAPAGFGKSTLVSQWVASSVGKAAYKIAWVGLDAADNDPARFWIYLASALQRIADATGDYSHFLALLRPESAPAFPEVLDELINIVALETQPVVLVLDDYHLITQTIIQEGLAYLVDHLPPSLRLVLVTRVDPPLALARLRSRGLLNELRAADLRFSAGELADFCAAALGQSLAAEDAAALEASTEGWPAGLQMAMLAVKGIGSGASSQDQAALHRFITSFSGKHTFILDYLTEEVFNGLPERMQQFLLQTSLLERLSGELCDAVTGGTDGQAQLEQLEHANLFMQPLDGERRWYRYHPLFADLLRVRLQQAIPAQAPALHARAAAWFAGQDLAAEAVGHALASRDWVLAGQLIERFWRVPLESGRAGLTLEWLRALPEESIRSSPTLGFAMCWTLWLTGHMREMAGVWDQTRRSMRDLALGEQPEGAVLLSQMAVLRSILLRYQGDPRGAVASAEESLRWLETVGSHLPAEFRALLEGVAYYHLAESLRENGDLSAAAAAFERAIPLLGPRSSVAVSGAFYRLARIYQSVGRLNQAFETCQRGLRYIDAQPDPRLPVYAIIHLAMGEVLCEQGEWQAAGEQLRLGLEVGRRDPGALRAAAALRQRLCRAEGWERLEDSLSFFDQAEAVLRTIEAPYLLSELAAVRARAWIERGRLDEVERWAEGVGFSAPRQGAAYQEVERLTFARLRIAQGRSTEVLPDVSAALTEAEASGRVSSQIELLLLRAQALATRRDLALPDLARAVELAAPEGYLGTFIDEGPSLGELLRELPARGQTRVAPAHQTFVARVLAYFTASAGPAAVAPRAPTGESALIEPLTGRELDVLRLLALGLSNRAIAERLFVSEGTVKTHIHNLAGKLDAQSRTQVVARAPELGII
jgi:LuxR family maltose regulon positive regulatory protein